MRSPACGLKFRGAWAQGAILAHAASHVTFHGYFESTSTKQDSTKFFQELLFFQLFADMWMQQNKICVI